MATGIEIVGLALAIFPVLVEGLRFYEKEKGTVQDLLHYRRVLKGHMRDLQREQLSFRNSCRLFLEDVALRSDLDAEDIEPMMQDKDDARWKQGAWLEPNVLDLESVQGYLETVVQMKELLTRIRDRLGIRANSSPEILDKKTRRRQWKIIKMVITGDEITEHLREATRLNVFLAQLTAQTRPAAPPRRSHRRHTRHYKKIRSDAMDLCHMLKLKFPTPPSCTCALPHQVNMRLEFRNAKTAKTATSFHTVFTLKPSSSCNRASIPWREMELQHCVTDKPPPPVPANQNANVSQQKSTMKSGKNSVKKVGFVNLHAQTPLDAKCKEIQDLCIFMAQNKTSTDWIGFITDGQTKKHLLRDIHKKHLLRGIHKNHVLASSRNARTMSLAQALSHKAPSRELRSKLGLKLASSVMQLHSTEWLADSWGAENIFFLKAADGTADITNPLIQRNFGTIDKSPQMSTKPVPCLPYVPCLVSLGVILLEIWYWKPFSALKTDNEMSIASQAPVYSDQIAAGRLVTSMDDTGPRYISAVKRCIFGLDGAYNSLEEDKFQGEVDEKIVFPLEEHLQFFCGKTTIEECF